MAAIFDAGAETVPSVPRHQLVLVDGRTFSISDEAGEMWAPTHGLVHDDVRHLSRLQATIEGSTIEVLASTSPTPLSAVIVGRVHDGRTASSGVLTLRRWVAGGLRQDLRLQNTSAHERRWTVRIEAAADFAHVFDVKAGRSSPEHQLVEAGPGWTIEGDGGSLRTDLRCIAGP